MTLDINLEASGRLARLARDAGVRAFVFASSCSVYGVADGPARRETDPVNPVTAYAKSKIGTEAALAGLDAPDMTITCPEVRHRLRHVRQAEAGPGAQ